ncbi:MAG: choice-of-anchor X domain-containing protein, partial [Dehalococcoidia bacterium]
EQGWMISALMLPSSAPEARDFLVSIVERTGGAWDDAGTVEGLAEFTHREHGLAPAPALSSRLQPGASALQPLEVAPETELLVVTTTRASAAARVEVFDPEGARAMHAAGLYTIYETPAFVVKTFARPRPGTWLLRATGDGEPILASVELRNPLQLVLLPQPPLVAGETGILLAAATVEGEPRPLPGAEITVTVRDPAGASVVYRLNDGGIGGDETAGDGVFSVAYAASALQGVNDVALTLAWDGYGATLGANASLKTEVFPTITLLPGEGGTLDAGGQLAVGAIEVTVGEYPFPVLPEQISLVVTGPSGVPLTGLVEPLETLPDGRGWRFKIITWPSETGAHSVTAELTGDYLERGFSASGARVETPVTVLRYVPPPPEPVSRTRDVITAALIALAVTAVLALAVAAWRLWRKVRPYGYFYDDNRRLVLDLSAVRKPGLRGLFSRDRVTGDDAPTLPVPASTLVFTHDGPELRYDNDANPTLRVDGRPARAVEKLRDGTIIGFAGRLFEFALSRRPAPTPAPNPEPAAGD